MLNRQAANVLDLLEYFARRRRPATLAEIADENGWPRSSTFNIVSTLADRGYPYEPAVRGGYYPSPRWLGMAQTVADAEPLPEALQALVARIAQESGETTAIGAPAGTSAIFLFVVELAQPIRYFAQVGHRLPIQARATGGYHRSLAEFSPDLLGVALPLPLAARRLSIAIAGPMFRCVDRLEGLAGMLRNGIRDVRRHLPQ
jgi:hypothetical protein